MPYLSHSSGKHSAGFGLVEIMVALVIGMLAVIIMLQVFAQSEERKRVSTSGGDAQTSGTIAFYQLQGDIAQAGFGISAMTLFNCPLTWKLPSGANIANPITLAPITINPPANIVPPGDANTDTLLIVYGNANSQPQGNNIVNATGNEYLFKQASAFSVGDRVIATADTCPAPLLMDRVTQTDTGPVIVEVGAPGNALFNLGPTPRVEAYAVRKGNLTVCDYMVNDCGAANTDDVSIWAPVATNIASMKAVYLRDTSAPTMDGIPDIHDQTTPTSACGWVRVSAVNLALVARSAQFNRDVVNAPVPTWSDNDAASIVGGSNSPLGPNTAVDEPWKHYRYRVFEATVPLRNVGWMGMPEGC